MSEKSCGATSENRKVRDMRKNGPLGHFFKEKRGRVGYHWLGLSKRNNFNKKHQFLVNFLKPIPRLIAK